MAWPRRSFWWQRSSVWLVVVFPLWVLVLNGTIWFYTRYSAGADGLRLVSLRLNPSTISES